MSHFKNFLKTTQNFISWLDQYRHKKSASITINNEFLKTKKEIKSWLNKYGVRNYSLIKDKNYGYLVNVNETVYLGDKNLSFIPVKFGTVKANFFCYSNKLSSLEFCPHTVYGGFSCSNNQLTSLKGCPQSIEKSFDCSYNQLNSLEFCPQNIGTHFNCQKNEGLATLQEITDFQTIYQEHLRIKKIKEENHLLSSAIKSHPKKQAVSFKI